MDNGQWTEPYSTLSREACLLRSRAAYAGNYKDSLKKKDKQVDPNVRLNYARVLVDKSVAALFGKDVALDVVEDEELGDNEYRTKGQMYLNAVWSANQKLALLQK